MIDIHCHILPNVDDGADRAEESIKMAKLALQEGIHTIIATPHYNHVYQNIADEIVVKVNVLNRLLQENDIPIMIYPGQEPRISGGIVQDLADGHLMTLNDTGKYLFIELPSRDVPYYTKELLYKIQLKGITPIIVHPERNVVLIENPSLLYEFVSGGALTQITAASVTGGFGKKVKKFSLDLIDHSLTHFIASDAHNISNRAFNFGQAFYEVEKQFGSELCDYLKENAKRVVSGEKIYTYEAKKIRKKWMSIF